MKVFPALICFCALAGAGTSIAAAPSTLLPGTINDVDHHTAFDHHAYECLIAGPASSTFMRNGTGPAVMTFVTSGINYTDRYDPGSGFVMVGDSYGGAAVLDFSNATSGLLKFDIAPRGSTASGLDPAHQNIPFSNYRQSYNSTTKILTISFELAFPHCSVPVKAIFHAG